MWVRKQVNTVRGSNNRFIQGESPPCAYRR